MLIQSQSMLHIIIHEQLLKCIEKNDYLFFVLQLLSHECTKTSDIYCMQFMYPMQHAKCQNVYMVHMTNIAHLITVELSCCFILHQCIINKVMYLMYLKRFFPLHVIRLIQRQDFVKVRQIDCSRLAVYFILNITWVKREGHVGGSDNSGYLMD